MVTATRPLTLVPGIACEADSTQTVPLSEERSFAFWQQDIPRAYWDLTPEEIIERIRAARDRLGQWAAQHPEAEYIVFCGVHFMAEAADILSAPHQKVVLPNMAAGCSMADMADPDDVYACWQELVEAGIADEVVPITYMNSAAALKAFVGEHGGAVCT